MKTNYWLVIGTLITTSAVAQVNTNKLPEIPPPATVAPVVIGAMVPTNTVAPVAKKVLVKHKKKAVKKISEPSVTMVAGPATVISENLNVRGQAGLKGEVIGHFKKGDTVTVISQINLDRHAADEPAQWAKISLPSDTKVWVNSKYVDAENKVVSARRLNLRGGPGENYSVLGLIEKGTPVNKLSANGDWMQIEPPANAFAFVAAMYLKQEVAPAAPAAAPVNPTPAVVEPAAVPAPATPPPTPSTVSEAQPIVTQPAAPAPDNNPPAAVTPGTPTLADTNTTASVVDTNLPPPPPRVVTHEGYVRSSSSIVAPTAYELFDLETGNTIDFLYSPTTNLNLSMYNGMQIMVTGEEGLSARWNATPVLTVQKIYVLSTNSLLDNKVVPTPRQQYIRSNKPMRHR